MRILVTGGAGYIGSHCSKEFSRRGWEVVVYDNLSRGWRDFVKWGELIEADILDRDAISNAVARVQPDVVAHFAALAYVGESIAEPGAYYRTNVVGTLNVLDAMRASSVSKFLFSSSCATYGEPKYLPIDEKHPQEPLNPYGRSKLMVEKILSDYNDAYGIRHVALRYFNAAGADPECEIGERHEPETHAIPRAIQAALDPKSTFSVFGYDYETADGTAVRDYTHVADLADAHARAVSYLQSDQRSVAINLGTNTGQSVLEIIKAVEQETGTEVRIEKELRRKGDPSILVANPNLAEQILGWRAKQGNLNEITADAVVWARKTTS